MKKSVKRALTVCGAAAMMLSAAQISAFADGDVQRGFPAFADRL